jgi:uncharacterized protein
MEGWMISEVDTRRDEIVALCRRHGVRRLELFGSAARGDWDPATSDVDFILEMDRDQAGLADRYLGFTGDLERLLGRPVDFVSDRKRSNPYLWASIDRNREIIYVDET